MSLSILIPRSPCIFVIFSLGFVSAMPREGRDRDRSKRAKLGMPGMMMQMQPHMMAPQMMPMMPPGNMMMPHHQMGHMGMPQHQQQMMMPSQPSSSDDEDEHVETGVVSSSTGAEAKAAAAQPPPGQTQIPAPAAGSHEQMSAEVARHMQPFPSEGMKQRISRSCSYVRQLPRWMLQEVLEFLNENFDATLVADLSVNGLLALIFLFTRIRPNVRVSELRVLALLNRSHFWHGYGMMFAHNK